MKSPQEGGFIFNQWFPNIENHYYAEIDNNSENHLKNYFNSVYSTSKKPILIKNGRNSVRLNVLSHIFKTARYIWVHRPPLSIAQSILKGREILKGDINTNWTVLPKEWEKIVALPYQEQVAHQVYCIDQQINQDLGNIPKENIFEINYSDFCKEPYSIATELCSKFPELKFRPNLPDGIKTKVFSSSQKIHLNSRDRQRIEAALKNLYGNRYIAL